MKELLIFLHAILPTHVLSPDLKCTYEIQTAQESAQANPIINGLTIRCYSIKDIGTKYWTTSKYEGECP